jgi:thiamine-phosphate pyrophosphorylase
VAKTLKAMLGQTPLFINTLDSPKLALEVNAEGVFLEEKLDPTGVRKILGEKAIIGIAIEKIDDAIIAEQRGEIDYLSIKLFPSKQTSPKNDVLWEMEGLRKIRALSTRRIVAIGGLNVNSVASVYRELHLDDGLAMAGALMREEDPHRTAQIIQEIRKKTLGVL